MNKTIIVSNRLPVQLEINKNEVKATPSVGGLATGMKSVHRDGNGIWVGWSGLTEEQLTSSLNEKVKKTLKEHQCVPVNLTEKDMEGFYYGFSNKTLWPQFHYFMEYTEFIKEDWETYKKVNEKFAVEILKHLNDGDQVWIHDYQLLLLPQIIKSQRPNTKIGFFLHIPFPSYEVYRTLPWRKEILKGMLGADLLGFHTYEYERHFLSSVQRLLGHNMEFNKILLDGREVLVDSFPMGIDYDKFANAAKAQNKLPKSERSELRLKLDEHILSDPNAKLILSIDRLDYTKGIPSRLQAFDYFLEKYPEYHEKVRLIMLAVPSRSNVPQYQLLKNEVDQLVGHINGKYSKVSWTPIWYFYRSMPFENLIDLYNACDIALITPLRDGMNLVAKEYIACREDLSGTLILSEMTGASQELSETILINPNNYEEVADTLKEVIEMPIEEQQTINETLQKRLKRYNVERWASDFLQALGETNQSESLVTTKRLHKRSLEKVLDQYKRSRKRLLFFDYDGTLAPFTRIPKNAKPTPEVFDLLDQLNSDEKNELVLITGRDRETFDEWFGHKNYNLVVEHGAWSRLKAGDWEVSEVLTNEWFESIYPILESFTDRTPGSLIEEKDYSLAWHYRGSDPDLGKQRVRALISTISQLIANHNLEILEGDKVVEIKVSGVNKGRSASKFVLNENYDFIFAIGDDWTDEFMYRDLPEDTVTVKVGPKKTIAKYRVDNTDHVFEIIKALNKAGDQEIMRIVE